MNHSNIRRPISQTLEAGGCSFQRFKLIEKAVTLEEYYKAANTKFCVLSDRNGKEHKSPWFYSIEHARQALNIIRGKGHQAIIYIA